MSTQNAIGYPRSRNDFQRAAQIARSRVKELLTDNQDRLRKLAGVLLERETLEGDEIRKILELPEKKKEQ